MRPVLNFSYKKLNKGVSTIPDECKGVGVEIGTTSKRKTTIYLWNI